MPGTVDFEKQSHVGFLYLNNPKKRNAITAEMWQDLSSLAGKISQDSEIRVTVLRGRGYEAFAAGADISQFESKRKATESGSDYDQLTEKAISAVLEIPTPVIALVHGYCLGGGLSLALACDLRIASTESSFSIPAARLGTAYPYRAIERLVKLVGASHAKYLLFSGSRIDASRAKEIGLVEQLFSKDDLDKAVDSITGTIVENAPLSVKTSKFTANQFSGLTDSPDYKTIYRLSKECFESRDYKEGVRAFMESRKPEFKGK